MMFRRRPTGRRPRRGGGQGELLLNRAHRLMAEGNYLQAAVLFERLAQGSVRRGIPRAPFLFIQAGKGYLSGGEKPKGFTLVKHGLVMLAEAGRWQELYRVGHRTLTELESLGFNEEKTRLAAWLEEVLPEGSERVSVLKPQLHVQRPILPTHCPQCGGVVDSQVVNWLDDVTAECLYCGSPVRTEV